MKHLNKRSSGILLPIFSLPNAYGIGSFGQSAYEFVDFLHQAGQRFWQILPLGQTSFGDSPYQSPSINAGNPYFIDLELLVEMGLLTIDEIQSVHQEDNPETVDYEKLYNTRFTLLQKAFERFDITESNYITFKQNNAHWLNDYALFMVLKKHHQENVWNKWTDVYKYRDANALEAFIKDNQTAIEYWQCIQYLFYRQWYALKQYANDKGVYIIGDIPIYVAYDSVDVWKNPAYFQLDENLEQTALAGCPPDGFTPLGQLWGNPIYRWDIMQVDNYRWWIDRIKTAMNLYDVIRIDHFRGFSSYYSIPAGETTAVNGEWKIGPGIALFKQINKALGNIDIIAEDLGFLTPEVIQMLNQSGFPGMKLLQFAFDNREENNYLPHNYTRNSIAYIGTHDNDTAKGWLQKLGNTEFSQLKDYLDIDENNIDEIIFSLIKRVFATVSQLAIISMQDYLMLGENARINTPSTLGNNWQWRMLPNKANTVLAEQILQITKLYQRI